MAEHVEDDEEDAAHHHTGSQQGVHIETSELLPHVPVAGAMRRIPTDGHVRVVLSSDLEFGVSSSASSRDLSHFATSSVPPAGGGV